MAAETDGYANTSQPLQIRPPVFPFGRFFGPRRRPFRGLSRNSMSRLLSVTVPQPSETRCRGMAPRPRPVRHHRARLQIVAAIGVHVERPALLALEFRNEATCRKPRRLVVGFKVVRLLAIIACVDVAAEVLDGLRGVVRRSGQPREGLASGSSMLSRRSMRRSFWPRRLGELWADSWYPRHQPALWLASRCRVWAKFRFASCRCAYPTTSSKPLRSGLLASLIRRCAARLYTGWLRSGLERRMDLLVSLIRPHTPPSG